jgi:hypothetical protein
MRAVALALLLCAACGVDIAYTRTNPPPHPMDARTPERVDVFRLAPNDRPFVETGILDETGWWGGGTQNADRLLRNKAAEIGCDALVIQGYVQGGARYRAICLVYKD